MALNHNGWVVFLAIQGKARFEYYAWSPLDWPPGTTILIPLTDDTIPPISDVMQRYVDNEQGLVWSNLSYRLAGIEEPAPMPRAQPFRRFDKIFDKSTGMHVWREEGIQWR